MILLYSFLFAAFDELFDEALPAGFTVTADSYEAESWPDNVKILYVHRGISEQIDGKYPYGRHVYNITSNPRLSFSKEQVTGPGNQREWE